MSSYAYSDINKEHIALAEDCSAEDCAKEFYCPTKTCPAKLELVAVNSNKRKPYFKAKKEGSHIATCCMPPSNFDATRYTDKDFKLDDLLSRLIHYKEVQKSDKTSKQYSHGDGQIKKPETLLTTYYLLKSYLKDDFFAGKKVSEQLIDGRLDRFDAENLEGIRIIECRFRWYDKSSKILFVEEAVNNKYILKLKFKDTELFKKPKTKYSN